MKENNYVSIRLTRSLYSIGIIASSKGVMTIEFKVDQINFAACYQRNFKKLLQEVISRYHSYGIEIKLSQFRASDAQNV